MPGPFLCFILRDGLSFSGECSELGRFKKRFKVAEHGAGVDPTSSHATFATRDFHFAFQFVFQGMEVLIKVGIEEMQMLLHRAVANRELSVGCHTEIQPAGIASFGREMTCF